MTNFEKWVENTNKEVMRDYENGIVDWETIFDDTVTICYNKKTNKTGISKLHPNDEFNAKIGRVIAYARTKGYAIPKQTISKPLCKMEYGEMFRYISHGNEYIRIFIAKIPNTFNRYVVTRDGYVHTMEDYGEEYEIVD